MLRLRRTPNSPLEGTLVGTVSGICLLAPDGSRRGGQERLRGDLDTSPVFTSSLCWLKAASEAPAIDVFDEVLQAVPPERPNGLQAMRRLPWSGFQRSHVQVDAKG